MSIIQKMKIINYKKKNQMINKFKVFGMMKSKI